MPIARVIADPSSLSASFERAVGEIEQAGLSLALSQIIDEAEGVVEMSFANGTPTEIHQILRHAMPGSDILVGEKSIEIPQLFISDMDSTIIGQECIDELADYAGLKPQIAEITERAMQGELDFKEALRERVGLLAGLDEKAITDCLAERIVPNEGARELVSTLKSKGTRTVLVTGGFHHFADEIGRQLGFDRVVGNRLAVSDGKLAGTLVGPIVDSTAKRATLEEERRALGEHAVVMACGDGANDIPMLEEAHYGVAYHGKEAALKASNGSIARGSLSGLLVLLQIPRDEFVSE
ncbi:phosphoserine phosphatase SerB [Parapontixanthobacter aurantiacus]|uniref:phosphoserine phosphatase SerB n=1 Tax=Parapontixanthobacter aurantiacus TaxID=1463599 RepID=UPI00301E4F54